MKQYNEILKKNKTDLKKIFMAGLTIAILVALISGCRIEQHDPHGQPVSVVTSLVSDQSADGDIAFSPPNTYIISSAVTTGTILAGIDPVHGDEFRGFLDFYLRDGHGVPYHATIEAATLEFFISDVSLPLSETVVPLIIDLVAFQPPTLIASDFDRSSQPPLLSLPMDILVSDEGTMVAVDVTSLMVEVQNQGIPDFQIRLVLDSIAMSGLVEIEDSVLETAPLLTVVYNDD